MMRFFFTLASAAYVAGIFLFADSSVVSQLSPFNPYSLLHIPLYGILTILLMFSFIPTKFNFSKQINPMNYFVVGLVALIVTIADEVQQSFIPSRDASIIDVFLDLLGVLLALLLILHLCRKKKRSTFTFKR